MPSTIQRQKGYYQERVFHPVKWKELQEAVISKLSLTTVLLYLMWFYEDMLKYTNIPHKTLPCMDWLDDKLSIKY